MIVITEAKIVEIDRDIMEIMSMPKTSCLSCTVNGEENYAETFEVQREIIKGRRIRRFADGLDIVLGVSAEIRTALGLEQAVFENMQNEILTMTAIRVQQDSEIIHLKSKLLKIKAAGFLKRLYWAFVHPDWRE